MTIAFLALLGCPGSDENPSCETDTEVQVKNPERVPDGFENPWAAFSSRWMGRFVGTAPELGEIELELHADEILARTSGHATSGGIATGVGCPSEYVVTGTLALRAGDGLIDESRAGAEASFEDFAQTGQIYASWPLEDLVGTLRPVAYNASAWQDNALTAELSTREFGGWDLRLYFEGEQPSGESYQEDLATNTPLRAESR